jgi:hypothetical protein
MNPSSISMPFPLPCLPAEIIRNIVAVCTEQELKSLRLSCKILEVIASEFLLENLLPKSFRRLEAISNHAKFSKNVRTIVWCAREFHKFDSELLFKVKC